MQKINRNPFAGKLPTVLPKRLTQRLLKSRRGLASGSSGFVADLKKSIQFEFRKSLEKCPEKWMILSVAFLLVSSESFAATGFGSRNEPISETPEAPVETSVIPPTTPAIVSQPEVTQSTMALRNPEPPTTEGVEWLKVPYEKAENEILKLFEQDLAKIEDVSDTVAVYEVRTTGQLPPEYQRQFRNKLERVLLMSKKLTLKQCSMCDESRITKSENGSIKYEAFSTDLGRPKKIANELSADHLIYTEIVYTPEDIQLKVKVVQPSNQQLVWSKEYSSADVVKSQSAYKDGGSGELGEGDSLGRVIIGEINFTPILSLGIQMMPNIQDGSGSGLSAAPSVDLFLGEKFDRGRKSFGFLLGGAGNIGAAGSDGSSGKPVPFLLRVAPSFRFHFNPYAMKTARFSLLTELGAMISTGITTGYVGVGPQVAMINRFAVSVMPMYILPVSAKSGETLTQGDNGSFSSGGGGTAGDFGGFGMMMKASIQW